MLYPILTLAFAAISIYVGVAVSSQVRRCSGWPSTTARVHGKELVAASSISKGRNFEPKVSYSYTVAGKAYSGEHVYCVQKTIGAHDQMQSVIDGLSGEVPVYYNPQDPSDSFLIHNSMGLAWLAFALGGVLGLIGALMLLVRLLNSSS